MITRFQQAVLQEMGIPLWITQAEAKSESKPEADAQVSSQPAQPAQASPRRSENSSSHLAALRQSISGEKSPSDVSPNEVSPNEVSPSEVPPSDMPVNKVPASDAVSANNASASQTLPPDTRSLSREEQQLAIMKDLSLAYENAGVTSPSVIEVGDELLLTETRLVLPGAPLSLSAADKKQIWTKISRGAGV